VKNFLHFFSFLGTEGPFAASGTLSKLTSCYGKEQPNEKDPAQSLPFGCFIAPQGDSGVPAVAASAELAVAGGGLRG
jgi:hypothetical protein